MNKPDNGSAQKAEDRLRVDKWLWRARVTHTRALAAALVSDGYVRINSQRIAAPGRFVKTGDVLTISLEHSVRVLRVVALGVRRGPAAEGRALYETLNMRQD